MILRNVTVAGDLTDIASAEYERLLACELDGSAVLFGAFAEDGIIGLLWAYYRKSHGDLRLHITQLGVESSYRFMGVGSALLRELEAFAVREGVSTIELMATLGNTDVVEFYEARGFLRTRVQLEKQLGGVR